MHVRHTRGVPTALILTLIVLSLISPLSAQAKAPQLYSAEDITLQAGGVFTLNLNAGAAPSLFPQYARYGTLIAEPLSLNRAVDRVQLAYTARTPAGSEVLVDLRASVDGETWQPWVIGAADGDVVGFGQFVRHVQYRVSMLADLQATPTIADITLKATNAPATLQAQSYAGTLAAAPTFRVRGTRQGMIGGRTANGTIIPPRARFVSLPCWCALNPKGQTNYSVRLTYRGRSTVVPVWDVGPYSGRDDYWNVTRSGYPDLERGWPMDHAAYYEGYNGRQADKGYVRFPTSVDVGDGAWWDDLGIVGDQAELEITFLWMGADPLAGPPERDPGAPQHEADELGGDFWQSSFALSPSAVGCGMGRHAYSANGVTDPAKSAFVARWQPNLPAGAYDVYAHVPICPNRRAATTLARYVVQHADGAGEVGVNQQTQTGWVHLGRFNFAEGTGGFVQLSDVVGDANTVVWYDNVRWVRAP
jgi:hypothetical protein